MKILHISPEFYPSVGYGGGPVVAYEICKMLVKRGHDVTVFTTDANDKHSRLAAGLKNIDGMKIHYFKNISNSIAYKNKLFISPSMIKAISSEINNFDIIHAHDYRTIQNIMLYIYARKYDIPYVLQAHGTVSPSYNKKELIKRIFDDVIGIRIIKDANKLIALTSAESIQYKDSGVDSKNIAIIPNGIDLSEYQFLPEKGNFRKKYSISSEEKIVLYLGRIHEIKGIDLLINAFVHVLKEMNNVRLVIIGADDGFLPIVIKQVHDFQIEDKVLFTGPLYGRDKLEAYVDTNTYVLPSRYETFPISVLEACICGIPVIVTKNCGIAELIDNNVGYAVDYNDKHLRDKIIEILKNEDLGKMFGNRGVEFVKGQFGWDKIIQNIEELYVKIYNESI